MRREENFVVKGRKRATLENMLGEWKEDGDEMKCNRLSITQDEAKLN